MTGRVLAAAARRALWRAVLTLTGGLRVHGAARLPAGISGTGTLLPPSDGTARRPRRAAVHVRIGVPVSVTGEDAVRAATAEARARVTALMA